MKIIILVLLLLLIGKPIFAEHGSFLILKSVYLYENSKGGGKKILTRKRSAYDVTGIARSTTGDLVYQIEVPSIEQPLTGTGFILESDQELKDLGFRKVKVFPVLPTTGANLTQYTQVPSHQLLFTGQKEQTEDFPNLIWRAVNFKIEVPSNYWVAEWAGIYRSDKDAEWLNSAYQQLIRKRVEENKLHKILLGLVEPGFTMDEVRWALGDPKEQRVIQEEAQTEWIYLDRKIIFQQEKVLRIL